MTQTWKPLAVLALCAGPLAAQPVADPPLRFGAFDALQDAAAIPAELRAAPGGGLFLVQLDTPLRERHATELRLRGLEVRHYVPRRAWLVRGEPDRAAAAAALPWVRRVVPVHPAWRLEPGLLRELVVGPPPPPRRYVVLLVAPGEDAVPLAEEIEELGGRVHLPPDDGNVTEATLTASQLVQVARLDRVAWIERWGPPEEDMDIVRIMGGADYVESVGGHTGKGVRGHVLEGIYPGHPEYAANAWRSAPIGLFSTTPSSHGSATFGTIFSLGVVRKARGVLPDGQGLYTHYDWVFNQQTRHALVATLVDPALPHRVMFQTASWGYPRTPQYTTRAAEMDRIIFDHDIPITQANGNGSGTQARPSSWAKNVIAVGGFVHFDNLNFADDCWCNSGCTGPAADGRIKPELSHFYDAIYSASGQSGYAQFGGTSASTPIVAGHVGLTIELFTDGLFGYPAAPSWQSRFGHAPHFTTSKALVVNTARQHAFSGFSHDMARNHQGWGMPDVGRMYRLKDSMLVIDELDVLRRGESRTYWAFVPPGTPEFRATMTHADPPALPLADPTRINSLDLRVDAPGGASYWGNNGLASNMFSVPGGEPNDVDTLENVWLQNPPAGLYRVEVRATAVRMDAHVETPGLDADYALVVSGLAGLRDRSGMELDLDSPAPGAFTVDLRRVPAGYAGGLTLFSLAAQRPIATGSLLGLETDALSLAGAARPPAKGDVFSFTATTDPAAYPNAPFAFPAAVAAAVRGVTLDAVALVYDAQARVLAVSNVDRVTVR